MTGIVKWFNDTKGYGFISVGESPDVFVHSSALSSPDGDHFLTQGQWVQFDVVQERGRECAANVVIL